MLSVGLLGALSAARRSLELARPKTQVEWVDVSRADRAVDLAVRLAEDDAPAPAAVPGALIARWARVPEPHALDDQLQRALHDVYGFVVGYSDAMHQVCRWIQVLAHPMTLATNVRALIIGPTGVGKDLVARAVHRLGGRADQPFVAVNCAALPRDLIAAELFGHERGAFTNAMMRRAGLLQGAGSGVVFFDEVSELPIELQPVLLRVLEDHAFRPLGSTSEIPFDAQVLSATNRDAGALVDAGAMRPDLYYRLSHVVIPVPSLAERADDVALLVRQFWHGVAASDLPEDIVAEATSRAWPGNVRELRHGVERVALLHRTVGRGALRDALGGAVARGASPAERSQGRSPEPKDEHSGTLAELRERFERDVLASVLRKCGGDLDAVARELSITRRSVYNLLKRHRMTPPK